jgi:serine/threonine-protein kinase
VEEFLDAALRLGPPERAEYLERVTAGDVDLRREVESLIAAHERHGALDRMASHFEPVAARVRETAALGVTSPEGTTVGRYQVQERIGGGGMGIVYKAVDTHLGRTVALKFLQSRLDSDDSAAERFRLEARTIAALEHPNICTIHEIGETSDGQLYLAMPLYDGETLQQRIARGPIPVAEAVGIATQVCRGLAKAHARGIVHRDIKPSNVLVTSDGVVKLLDFGIAKLVDVTLTGGAGPLGTVAYMSPEQARGEAVDHRTDLWSLGVVLHEMLAGRRPHAGETAVSIARALQNESTPPGPSRRSAIPPALDRVVAKALAVKVSDRYDSAQAFEEALLGLGIADPMTTRTLPVRPRARQRVVLSAMSLVMLGGVLAYVWTRGGSPPPASAGPVPATVAVLPFVDRSPGRDQEYFSDGITEELISTLARTEGVRVASRTSSFAFKNRNADIRVIADSLDVATVVEGSVRRDGEALRIDARLVNASDGSLLWTDSFDRRSGDAFMVQQEIARAIAQTLRVKLVGGSGSSGVPAPDEAAYEWYLKGRYAWYTRSEEGLRTAVTYFQRAVDEDSLYVQAHAGLADAYAVLGFYDYMTPMDAFPKAEASARRAADLAPFLAGPRATLGYAALYHRWDFKKGEEEFRRSISLNATYSTAHQWYANLLTAAGRFDEAEREMRRAQEIDPLSLIASAALGWVQYYAGDYAAAAAQCLRTLELNPTYGLAHLWRGWALQEMDSLDAAVESHRQALAVSDSSALYIASLARSLAKRGDRAEAESLLQRLQARLNAGTYTPAYEIAKVHEALGRPDEALKWLDRAFEQRAHSMVFLRVDPQLKQLRSHPRFRELVRQVFRDDVDRR